MKELKFKTGEDIRFFQTLRARVDTYFKEHGLSQHANAAMVVKTVVLILAYLGPFIAMLIFQPPFAVMLPLWMLMGWAMAGVGMSIMHDANHGAYSAKKYVNRILGLTLNSIGGTAENWKVQHNLLHHTYTNVTGVDEDIQSKTILRLSPHAQFYNVQRNQWWYAFLLYSIGTMYWALAKDFIQHISYRKQGLHHDNRKENNLLLSGLILTKVLYFFVYLALPVLVGIAFWKVLTGFLVMHVICGVILAVVFQLAHTVEETTYPMPDDHGNLEDAWAVHQMKTTMNFACQNKWLSWYVGGLNFQVEHHLFTRICHVHYPAIAPIVKQTAREFGVPYLEQKTFRDALGSHVRLLKSLGRTPRLEELID